MMVMFMARTVTDEGVSFCLESKLEETPLSGQTLWSPEMFPPLNRIMMGNPAHGIGNLEETKDCQ